MANEEAKLAEILPQETKVGKTPDLDTTGGGYLTLKEKTDDHTRELERHNKEMERIRQDLSNERLNIITIFGTFAALVTFFSVEIQAFKYIDNFWLLIGLSSFLVSSLMLFSLSLHAIIRDRLKWKDFLSSPIFWILVIFLILAGIAFFIASKGTIELKITN